MKRREFLVGTAASSIALTYPMATQAEENSSPPPLIAYARSPAIEDAAVSADGTLVAFMTTNEGQRQIAITELKSMISRNVLTNAYKTRGIFFIGNEHIGVKSSAYQSARHKDEQSYEEEYLRILILKNTDSGDEKLDFTKSKSIFDCHTCKTKDSYFLVGSEVKLRNGATLQYNLNNYNLNDLNKTEIDIGSINNYDWIVDFDGSVIARAYYKNSTKKFKIQFNKRGFWNDIYNEIIEIDLPKLLGLGQDGKSLIVFFNSGPMAGHYVEMRLDGTMNIIHEGDNASAAIFHPGSKRLCGFTIENDWVEYRFLDPIMKKINDAMKVRFAGYRYRFHDFSEDPRKLIVYFEGPDASASYSFIDLSTGEEIFIGDSYPELPKDTISEKKLIHYNAQDGLEIPAYLTLPSKRKTKSLPLIVMPHGGPHSRDTLDFDWQTQALASRGYAVLQPNFRGSSGYTNLFLEAGYGEWGRKMQTDLSDGVRHLVKEGIIDPSRVSIVGASYGGYAALAGATLDRGIFNCAISIAGVSNIQDMAKYEKAKTGDNRNPITRHWKRSWGDVDYASISPITYVKDIEIPILLIHGKKDTVVPISQSRNMNEAMKLANKNVTLLEFEDEDHWQSLAPARLEMIEAIMAFLDKHNPAFI